MSLNLKPQVNLLSRKYINVYFQAPNELPIIFYTSEQHPRIDSKVGRFARSIYKDIGCPPPKRS